MENQTAEKPKQKPVLHPTAMRSNGADYVRTYHHVKVGTDITREDILRPSFWAHHTTAVRVGDLIDVLSEDGGIDLQLRVEDKGVGFVKVRERFGYVREDKQEAPAETELPVIPEGYEVKRGPRGLWRTFTTNPQFEVKGGMQTQREAIDTAIEHARKAA